jgi:predicted permease
VIEHLIRDLGYAFRAIRRMPGLAAVVVVSLGVGIGVNTAIFTRIQYMVLQPLPGAVDSGSLHLVEPRAESGAYPGISWLEYRDLQEQTQSFRGLIAARMVPFNVGDASRVERTFGQLVSGNYFSELGLRPALGRFLSPEEVDHIGRESVVVVSYDFWQSRFAGASVAGQTIRVNGQDLAIVGVAPPEFQGTVLGLQFDLWIPATLAQSLLSGSRELEDRSQRGYGVMGQLKAGTTREQAQADVDGVLRDLARMYPETSAAVRGEVLPFWQPPRGPQRMFLGALGVLQAIMLVVLLTICGNTATLMLARATARQREIGVRLAVGASRWRVVAVVLTENVVLALVGAALGAVIAVWATEALRTIDMPGNMPFKFQTRVDALGFGFATLLGLGCGLIFGAAPALHLARIDPQRAIRAGAPLTAPHRMRSTLMGVQVALALVVLVVASLFIRSFARTRGGETGFVSEGLLLATYDLTGRDIDPRTFAARVQEQLRGISGVEEAAIAVSVPLDIHGLPVRNFSLEGRARTEAGLDRALSNTVTPGYFRTMGIPLRAGTDFVDLRDVTAPAQAIVNEAFVDRYLDGAEALGRRVQNGTRSFVITGVVATSISDAFDEPPAPALYFSYRDRPAAVGEMHVRTRGGSEAAVAADVRRVMSAIDSSLPIYNVRSMSTHIDKNLIMRRIPAQIFVVVGPMLVALAMIGIYSVVAHIVAGHTAEIGVRMALGATARRVVGEIMRQSLKVIAVGALAGWVIACVIALDVMREGFDAMPILIGVPAILLLVATVACWWPARRATKVDPASALRES